MISLAAGSGYFGHGLLTSLLLAAVLFILYYYFYLPRGLATQYISRRFMIRMTKDRLTSSESWKERSKFLGLLITQFTITPLSLMYNHIARYIVIALPLYAVINFFINATLESPSTVLSQELTNGILPLRGAALLAFASWLTSERERAFFLTAADADFLVRYPKAAKRIQLTGKAEMDDMTRYGASVFEVSKSSWATANNKTDQQTKESLGKIPFSVLPANLSTLHRASLNVVMSALVCAIGLLWARKFDGIQSIRYDQTLLHWLTLTLSYDIGIIYGYAYVFKGHIIAIHRLRILLWELAITLIVAFAAITENIWLFLFLMPIFCFSLFSSMLTLFLSRMPPMFNPAEVPRPPDQ